MRHSRSLALLALLGMIAISPTAALAAIGEVWKTAHGEHYYIREMVDPDGNGSLELLTAEQMGPSDHGIGVRAAATGALLAQTITPYVLSGLLLADLDGDGSQEILFTNGGSGRLTCLRYTGPSGPLSLFWEIRPSQPPPFTLSLADLDGTDGSTSWFSSRHHPGRWRYTPIGARYSGRTRPTTRRA
jgi:hypothetical protein